METNIQRQVNRLNVLYQRIITNRCIDADTEQEQFKNLFKQIKGWGYKFKPGNPEIDFSVYSLNELESRHYELLELIQMARKYGEINNLYTFAYTMRNSEICLCREIYVSLCKREVIENGYFQMGDTGNWIDFMESGHWIDACVMLRYK